MIVGVTLMQHVPNIDKKIQVLMQYVLILLMSEVQKNPPFF